MLNSRWSADDTRVQIAATLPFSASCFLFSTIFSSWLSFLVFLIIVSSLFVNYVSYFSQTVKSIQYGYHIIFITDS